MQTCYKEASKNESKYWKNKPVMKFSEKVFKSSEIYDDTELAKLKKDVPTPLPPGYEWVRVELSNDTGMIGISNFLSDNYKRGTESKYVLKYDTERLRWEMNNVGYFLSIVHENKIIGLIGMTVRNVQIYSDAKQMAEPLYMCCESKYRNKGIAKVLMNESIRQSLIENIKYGVYTDNRIVPKPIITLRQYSRPINYKKLRENDFVEICGVDDDIVHNRTKINLKPNKRYVVAEKTEKNIDLVYKLYNTYMQTFSFNAILSKKDIEHYMFNDKYAKTILIMAKKGDTDEIDDTVDPVDFITYNFYDLVNLDKTENNIIKVANLFMYTSNETRVDLIFVNLMKQLAYDKQQILYIMDMMESNESILSLVKNADEDTDDEEENATYDMNIVKTGKKLFINLFNWKCEPLKQNMISWLTF
jgi:hypothetical protein